MNKIEFDKWVDKMIAEYNKTVKRFYITINDYNSTTLCGDSKTGRRGMAWCHPDDEFNDSYGIAIAYARCRGYEIPKLTTYKKLSEMKYGDRFLSISGNKIYAFIGHSTIGDRYIVENTIEEYACYCPNNDEYEYEMVE